MKQYKFWHNFIWYFKIVARHEPTLFLWMFLGVAFTTGQMFLTALLPSVIVTALTEGRDLKTTLWQIFAVGLALNLCQQGASLIWKWASMKKMTIRVTEMGKAALGLTQISYEKLEDPKVRERYQRSFQNAFYMGNSSSMEAYLEYWYRFLQNIMSLLFFLGTLAVFNPWIMLLIVAGSILSFIGKSAYNRFYAKIKEQYMHPYTKKDYLRRNAYQIESGKDLRLYHMWGWYKKLIEDNHHDLLHLDKRNSLATFLADLLTHGVNFAQNLGSYLFLLLGATAGRLTLGQFTLYFGFVNQFSTLTFTMVDALTKIKRADNDNSDYRNWEDEVQESVVNFNERKATFAETEKIQLVFQNVSYQYPHATTKSVDNVSFTITPGEKIALVGANGAGKTTIVKLINGLLEPTSGKILLNGVDVTTLDRTFYQQLIAPVFQDSLVFALSLGQNVSLAPTYEGERLAIALKQSYLGAKVASLAKGVETPLTHYLAMDGVELSGGEEQKLMLARALYKDAPVLILDEPTAALDALAEREMYEGYSGLVQGKTSLFISHRLASTRFCDRIFFMDQGQLLEVGTHEELLKQKGKYAEMYHVQSYYYQKEVAQG
ncbi:ABC transporter ATP-binding protein [Enterococcus nangangensis]|uniref:ABC transporter ATP-binding protein n=1 Tax=Enterococcus nangangensis TaxID=2559926 RepID=UPI0010F4B1A2|nr:ABC transporter ATP-binding protein [Enterococcus nangangensis]